MKEELEQSVKTSPTISVIVPVYNAEKYLHRCIDSVLAQTYKDFELLLIDDGSKDSSGAICDEYAAKDTRVRVFHKENGGVSSARNLGLDNAQGEWITFVDSDDYIEENFLESFEGNLDADLVVGNMIICEAGKSPSDIDAHIVPGKYCPIQSVLKGNLTKTVFCAPWGKLFRNDGIRDLRFDVGMTICEDTKFVYNYIAKAKDMRILSTDETTHYVYMYPSIPSIEKYQMSVESSVYCLLSMEKAYQEVGVYDRRFELIYVQECYERCAKDMANNYRLWYGNKAVKVLSYRRSSRIGLLSSIRTFWRFNIYYYLKLLKIV